MNYCDNCAKEKGWPITGFASYGRCEICGERRLCSDMPSSKLPLSKDTFQQYTKMLQTENE